MPDNPLERLLINLQTAHKVYERLLELAEKKRLHIVQNDLAALRRDVRDRATPGRRRGQPQCRTRSPAPRMLRGVAR